MDLGELAYLRLEYSAAGLGEDDVDADPFAQFGAWFSAWREVAVGDPNAMVLATATADGRPSLRTVLLKGITADAFLFFSNYESRKGRELAANPRAALLFPWHAVGRQVIVEGTVETVDAAVSDAYWATRPWGSRLAAVASPQSRELPGREVLEERFDQLDRRYAEGDLRRPDHWGGYRVVAQRFELWQGREDRMHDRLTYVRDPERSTGWRLARLAP